MEIPELVQEALAIGRQDGWAHARYRCHVGAVARGLAELSEVKTASQEPFFPTTFFPTDSWVQPVLDSTMPHWTVCPKTASKRLPKNAQA